MRATRGMTSLGCLVAPLLMAGISACASLGSQTLSDSPTPLLDDRLTIRAPSGIENEARVESIMAAPSPEDEETRLMLSVRREMLLVMTYELFALASYDFTLDAARWSAGMEEEWGPIEVASLSTADPSLRAFSFTPETTPITGEPVFIFGVLIASPDDTLQYLAFYVNDAAGSDVAGAQDLARRMAGTLADGSRPLDLSAGDRTLQVGPGSSLTITVEENMAVTHEIGPDFDVFRVWPVGLLLEDEGSIGVYVGGHPALQYQQADGTGEVVAEPGRLFDQDMTWQRWTRPAAGGGVRYRLEAIVPHPASDYLLVHVFLRAHDEAQLERLQSVAETLRMVPGGGGEPSGPR